MNELRATELAGEANSVIWNNKGAWITAALLPGIVFILLDIGLALSPMSVTPQEVQAQAGEFIWRWAGIMLVQTLALAVFGVAWHRFLLLQEQPRVLPAIGGNHVWFAALSILLAVLATVPFFLTTVVFATTAGGGGGNLGSGVLIMLIAAVLSIYVFLRFCLAFPIAAIGGERAMSNALRLTKGNVFKLFWAFLLAALPAILASLVIGSILVMLLFNRADPTAGLPQGFSAAMLIGVAINTAMSLYISATFVGVASGAYRRLTQ